MNIYVGNLAFDSTEETLKAHFERFGEVSSTKIIEDRMTGKSRGFAFVEMPDDAAGQKAIDETNGKDFMGRDLRVNQARPREDNR